MLLNLKFWLKSTLILLSLILLFGLFATSYKAGFIFLFGTLLFPIGWGLLWLARKIFLPAEEVSLGWTLNKRNRLPLFQLIAIAIMLITIIVLFSLPIFLKSASRPQMPPESSAKATKEKSYRHHHSYSAITSTLTQYQIYLRPKDDRLHSFNLKAKLNFKLNKRFPESEIDKSLLTKEIKKWLDRNEEIKKIVTANFSILLKNNDLTKILNQKIELTTKEIQIDSKESGFAIRTLSFSPDKISFPDKINAGNLPRIDNNPELKIEIKKLPKGAFYQVDENPQDLEITPFLNNETIKWSSNELEDEISIAYFSSPYYHFPYLFRIFAGVINLKEGFIVLLGLFYSSIIFLLGYFCKLLLDVLNSLLSDAVKQWVNNHCAKHMAKAEPSTNTHSEVPRSNTLPSQKSTTSVKHETPSQTSTETNTDESQPPNPSN